MTSRGTSRRHGRRGAALAACVLASAWTGAAATEPTRAAMLYENHCAECHTTEVHFRAQRKARSLGDISTWVRRWQRELKLEWDAHDVAEVTEHLNTQYYGFKRPQ